MGFEPWLAVKTQGHSHGVAAQLHLYSENVDSSSEHATNARVGVLRVSLPPELVAKTASQTERGCRGAWPVRE